MKKKKKTYTTHLECKVRSRSRSWKGEIERQIFTSIKHRNIMPKRHIIATLISVKFNFSLCISPLVHCRFFLSLSVRFVEFKKLTFTHWWIRIIHIFLRLWATEETEKKKKKNEGRCTAMQITFYMHTSLKFPLPINRVHLPRSVFWVAAVRIWMRFLQATQLYTNEGLLFYFFLF